MKLKNRGQRDMLDQEQELRFSKARRGAIAREFAHLNPEQQRAVLATEGLAVERPPCSSTASPT